MRLFQVGSLLFVLASFLAVPGAIASAQSRDQVAPTLSSARRGFTAFLPHGSSLSAKTAIGSDPQPPFDSIPTFSGEFHTSGFGPQGEARNRWFYTMAGGRPQDGGTTEFDAPIVPVSLDLLDWDKSVRVVNGHKLHSSVASFVEPVLNSPVFQDAEYTSSDVPTQFTDAVQRASFYNSMRQDWHTRLRPSVKTEHTISVPRGAYRFALEKDGSCCAFVLIDMNVFAKLLFPSKPDDQQTPVGAAEHSGEITPQSIATFLLPNTYLYANSDPNLCCVLGFHTYDFEPGDKANAFREKRYVMAFASWISPGLFGPEFQDVTAVSHEMAEAFNDPFVASDGIHGLTPWWYSVNGHCQNDLEVADVLEGLAGSTFAVRLKGRTYHPQNVALLPWFEFQSPSTALAGSYSYPNSTLLTALSPTLGMNCR